MAGPADYAKRSKKKPGSSGVGSGGVRNLTGRVGPDQEVMNLEGRDWLP